MRPPEIRIVAVGRVHPEVLEYLALTVSGTFDTGCHRLGVTLDTQGAYDSGRRQYNSTQLLAKLLKVSNNSEGMILGVTEVDLFIPILTFVFGQAQLGGPAALISTHRLRPQFYGLREEKQLFYSRCEKEANHELGHACGLGHCRSYDCAMHVSNSVEQVDLKRSSFCSACEMMMRAVSPRHKASPEYAGGSPENLFGR